MTRVLWLVGAVVVAVMIEVSPILDAQRAAMPTYNGDVGPVLDTKCAGCHRPGGSAPMSLTTYAEVRPWIHRIKEKVQLRQMPPWFADPRFGEFRNDRSLTASEIDAITAWVDTGGPEGSSERRLARAPATAAANVPDRLPDYVVESPEFEIPATGVIPVFTFWQRLVIRERLWIEALRATPSNSRMVHHASVAVASLPPGAELGSAAIWPGGPVLDGVPLKNGQPLSDVSAETFGHPLLFYVPGGGTLWLPRGIGKALDAGEFLVWGFHFTTGGKVERGRIRLEVWTARSPVDYEAVTITAVNQVMTAGRTFSPDASGKLTLPPIPPHAADWEVIGTVRFDEDVTLHALWPHMHHRGKDMTFRVRYPNGREEVLLSVPRYDFNWQLTYELAQPKRIPAGSLVTAVAHYDNSSRNPHNPDPASPVEWGAQSWNEMFNPFLEITYDRRRLR